MTRDKKIQISKIILGVIAVAGVLSIALIAPNVFIIVKIFRGKNDYRFRDQVKKSLKRLEQRGSVVIVKGRVKLTSKGRKELLFYEIKKKIIKHPKRWDKKWRVVIFDVWEKRRNIRNEMRVYLSQMGFVRLQNSVWIYPYECEEAVELFKIHYKLRSAVNYLVVERIDDDKKFKKIFKLK